ncbi:hypothetical protein PLESTM_001479100 [Pleodorina starrii]|nr:hypothetical protein PLESTM_001479100 [Pleodorina starrii]
MDKAVLRFILSGNTSFWSRPEVATRVGFGTAPWRCIDRCRPVYYEVNGTYRECEPDCTTPVYCEPGGRALSDPNTTCCALSLLDQSYSFTYSPNATTTPRWCSAYPAWGNGQRPSVCDFHIYAARRAFPPGGANDPHLAVACKRAKITPLYNITGTQYRSTTAARILQGKAVTRKQARRNIVYRISLRHTPAWHHPSVNITQPPEFSLVDDLVCLPLEEIYFEDVAFRAEHELLAVNPDRRGANGTIYDLFNYTTWVCNMKDDRPYNLTLEGFPEAELGVSDKGGPYELTYYQQLLSPCGVGRALVSRNVSSLNPNLALRSVALEKCIFSPITELNAMRSFFC